MNTAERAANPLESHEKPGESFIPMRHRLLARHLAHWLELSGSANEQYEQLWKSLLSIFHIEHLTRLMQVEELYSLLDPDDESLMEGDPEDEKLTADTDLLLDRISSVLDTAHYHRLSEEDLDAAIRVGCQWGVKLDVDFSLFESLRVFARGYRIVQKRRRRWQNLFRQETIDLPEFHRLVIAFRVKSHHRLGGLFDPRFVYLKMFKNIPETDLEVLLPGSTVKLSMLDRGKILLPTLSGAAITLYKIGRGVMLVTLATVTAFWNWLILMALLGGYILRSIFSYFNTKDKYQLGLTRNLYLKNLDNNLGVIYRLFNEAEDQELCETILVYSVLLRSEEPLSEQEIRLRTESLLLELTRQPVRFDIHDALGKLARFRLAEVDSRFCWQVIPLEQAPATLAQYWADQLRRGQSLPGLNQVFSPVKGAT